MRRTELALWALSALLAAGGPAAVNGQVSKPGGAGHALLFRDHAVVLENFNDLGEDALTFEAWVSSSDFCHDSAVFSYSMHTHSDDVHQQTADFNHFVIFDPKKLVACHDFEFIDLWPDLDKASCYAQFNGSANRALPSYVSRDGRWHHLAVTWTRANNGLTKIYWDGLLKVQAETGKTGPLRKGGALMLGAEQDCYGGCVDEHQGYYGLMDEVRIWRTARTQEEIIAHMRSAGELEGHQDLAAYWRFDDPEHTGFNRFAPVAADASGRGNHLPLVTLQEAKDLTIAKGDKSLRASALSFHNNFLMNNGVSGMPQRDFTVEFWARTPAWNSSLQLDARYTQASDFAEFFSYATTLQPQGGRAGKVLVQDAILIDKYMTEFRGQKELGYKNISTRGTVSVRVNANRKGSGGRFDNWLDFNTEWIDGQWKHLAVTWAYDSGEVRLYLDGQDQRPYWASNAGVTQLVDPAQGAASNRIAGRSGERDASGSLVLGQVQDCMGGCLSAHYGFRGDLANVRIWDRVLDSDAVVRGMWEAEPSDRSGLVASWAFNVDSVIKEASGARFVRDAAKPAGDDANALYMMGAAPLWVYSDAPLARPDGSPLPPAQAGSGGWAMHLGDQQVLILKNFQQFPADEVTVEFWMLSTDTCRKGTPFSYAVGSEYGVNDNAFTIFGYNDWGVAVMEDEGTLADHTSGVASTDGSWHHVAVTWRSEDGAARLFDNGREVWSVTRARGKRIPSGGTLVIGREQDCEGGCFDSAKGAAGSVDARQEYGAEDFFGLIDELRIWRKARSPEEIAEGMRSNLFRKGSTGERYDSQPVDPHHPDLVAYWSFDEGTGYVVNDKTGKGHHLRAAEPPRWAVVRGLAVCGNGVLEGLEECDDGDTEDGDGCSANCKVEEGWECTKTSPSTCWRKGDPGPPSPPSPVPDAGRGGGAAPPPPPRHRRRAGRIAGGVLGLAALAMATAVALAYREHLYDSFPALERAAGALSSRLGAGGAFRRFGYSPVGGNQGELGGELEAPDFTDLRPAPARGPYERLPPGEPSPFLPR